MHLRQLRYLRLILEHGSFAAAARAAGISQSAISQAMQALEREWGFTLFERHGRRKPPPQGHEAPLHRTISTGTLQRASTRVTVEPITRLPSDECPCEPMTTSS